MPEQLKKWNTRLGAAFGTVAALYGTGVIPFDQWPPAVVLGIGLAGLALRDIASVWKTGRTYPAAADRGPNTVVVDGATTRGS